MRGLWSTAGLAALLFASTNVDDIFVLVAFFSDRAFRAREVVVGQFLGMVTLISATALLSKVARLVPSRDVGLLGAIPVVLGVVKLVQRGGSANDGEHPSRPSGGAFGKGLAVALVTVANGGDNIGVYVPVFTTRTRPELAAMIVVFLILVTVWCGAGYHLVNHPRLGRHLRLHARRVTPFVFIALGLFILIRSQAHALGG
jgi:cadmium resistance transport/sequestration family protein